MKKECSARVVEITCNACGKVCISDDFYQIQEFLSYSDIAGYENFALGDRTIRSIDLCQWCVKKILGAAHTD